MAHYGSSPPASYPSDTVSGSFSEDASDPENIYTHIQTDPRYVRLLHHYAPALFTGKGLKQRCKNSIGPQNIPVIGIVCSIYRAGKSWGDNAKVDKVEATNTNEELKDTFQLLHLGQKVHVAKTTTNATVGSFFQLMPVTAPLGPIIGGAAGFGAKKGAAHVVKTGAKHNASEYDSVNEETPESLTHRKWEATRAFLLYLGLPKTSDPLYLIWEDARLQLKSTYGAKPEDNLYSMKPDKELEKKIKEQEKEDKTGAYNLEELKVSLLLLLWRIYECWDEFTYDMIQRKMHDPGYQDELDRIMDVRYVQEFIHPISPQVVRLDKLQKFEAIELLQNSYEGCWNLNHPQLKFLVSGKSPSEKEKEHHKGFLEKLVKFWYKKQQLWGYFDDGKLVALAFWQAPENEYPSFTSFFTKRRIGGAFGIGLSALGKLSDFFTAQQKLLESYVQVKPGFGGVLHCFAARPRTNAMDVNPFTPQSPAQILLNGLADYIGQPTFAFIAHPCPSEERLLTSVGFKPIGKNDEYDFTLLRREPHLKSPVDFETMSKARASMNQRRKPME